MWFDLKMPVRACVQGGVGAAKGSGEAHVSAAGVNERPKVAQATSEALQNPSADVASKKDAVYCLLGPQVGHESGDQARSGCTVVTATRTKA